MKEKKNRVRHSVQFRDKRQRPTWPSSSVYFLHTLFEIANPSAKRRVWRFTIPLVAQHGPVPSFASYCLARTEKTGLSALAKEVLRIALALECAESTKKKKNK